MLMLISKVLLLLFPVRGSHNNFMGSNNLLVNRSKALCLIVFGVVFLVISSASGHGDGEGLMGFNDLAEQGDINNKDKACYDVEVCTRYIPPQCCCQEVGTTCHAACKNYKCTKSNPPQCRCTNITLYSHGPCTCSTAKRGTQTLKGLMGFNDLAKQGDINNKYKACCDFGICALSYPPKCHCKDAGTTCHAACKGCICAKSNPPQCHCTDITPYSYGPCTCEAANNI